ncbi:MAG: class I SAM-dependent methyltransferase [Acidobacteriaceae bacterium]|nr:class I SAM-dependent methyltransferase [Acidobacteriaceae bacterium]
MKRWLKSLAARLSATPVVRSSVVHLVYPNIVRCLREEVQPDVEAPEVVQTLAWKSHSCLVLQEELTGGKNCCPDRMRSDRETRAALFSTVLENMNGCTGDILEFGVSSGESFLYFLNQCPERQVYGFDSFDGLPEDWWTRPKGTFKAEPPRFDNPNGHLIKGLFDQTLPRFIASWNGRAALVHVDCDLYRSSITVLTHVLPYCRQGSIVVFDEYYNYSEFARHEWLAWRQARASFGITAACIAYDGRRAAFQITRIDPFGK